MFVTYKERQFKENYRDFLQSTGNTNTDEEDWDFLFYSLRNETGKLKEQIESQVTSLEKKIKKKSKKW